MSLDSRLLAVLACPIDKGPLFYLGDDGGLYNPRTRRRYLVRDGIIEPLALLERRHQTASSRKTASSRVEFFTVSRGD